MIGINDGTLDEYIVNGLFHVVGKMFVNALKMLTGSLVVIMDITEQYQAEQRLKQIAHHDALTGLPNRTSFLEHLNNALQARSLKGIVALLFIDLDGFKAVNDTLGHDAGDELLQQVARRLRHTVRDEDNVARIWNQGNAGPCVKGTNSKGVKYNSCAYEKKILALLR